MKRARSIIFAGCTAMAVALLSIGCATSPSGRQTAQTQATPCPNCTITVVDQVPLPVSTDLAVARLDQAWTVVEHTCACCEGQSTRFFASADFEDDCTMDETTGLCCANQHAHEESGLAQVTR